MRTWTCAWANKTENHARNATPLHRHHQWCVCCVACAVVRACVVRACVVVRCVVCNAAAVVVLCYRMFHSFFGCDTFSRIELEHADEQIETEGGQLGDT